MTKNFNIFLEELGKRIKQEREKQKISIKKISEITGIKQQYLQKIEAGKAVRINVTHLFLIAEALNIEPDILAGGL